MKSKKGYLQISFAWIFAIVVGAFIIFLAIYAVNKISDSSSKVSDITLSKEIGILLNPLETGFEESKSSFFSVPKDSRISFKCEEFGTFGEQNILLRSENFNKRSQNNLEISLPNKYVFSEKNLEGKNFNLFSKVFDFPFKTATLIYITPAEKNYCFIDAPKEIEQEINNLKIPEREYLFTENCPENSIEVCFKDDCDISVRYGFGEVNKERETLYFYEDALMYAAIFSDKDNYNCQLKRLMKKVASLSNLYLEKSQLNSECRQEAQFLNEKLNLLENFALNFQYSEQINFNIISLLQDIEKLNDNIGCKLW